MGGLVRHYYFSKYLTNKGHRVKIFTSSKIHNSEINIIKDKVLLKEEIIDGVEYSFIRSTEYKGNGFGRIFNIIEFPLRLFKVSKTISKPDVIYTSSPDLFTALTAILIAKKFKIKVVVEIRDLWPESIVEYSKISKKNIIIKILYKLEKWIYKKADKLVFTMSGGKNYIIDKGWNNVIDLNKIYQVNNGVDIDEFNINKENSILNDIDLTDNTFKVIYMGSIRKVNHIISLVQAARVLQERGFTDIKILIYGDGTEKKELEELSKRLELNNLKFKGFVEKKYVAGILTSANVNVVHVQNTGLSKYGCSWNKLFEYMASGKPILSNCPQEDDLINKYDCGISKYLEKPEEYADSILYFYNMEQEKYNKICTNALTAAREYDYKKLTNDIEKILN
jgi:glycosyltransferase involved in cell wall biosynthesis